MTASGVSPAHAVFPDLRGMTESVAWVPYQGIDSTFDESFGSVHDKLGNLGPITPLTGREGGAPRSGQQFLRAVDDALGRLKGVPTPELNLVIDSHGGHREICLPFEQPWSHLNFVERLETLLRARGVANLTLNVFYNACQAGSMTRDFQYSTFREDGVKAVNLYTSSAATEKSYGQQFFEVVDRLNKTITRAEAAGFYREAGATPTRSEVFARSWPEVINDIAIRETNRELPGWSSQITAESRQELRYAIPVYLFTDSQEESNRILEKLNSHPERAHEELTRVSSRIPAGSGAADRAQLLRFVLSKGERLDTASLLRLALIADKDQTLIGRRLQEDLRAELFKPDRAKDLARIVREDPAKSGAILETLIREFFVDPLTLAEAGSPLQLRLSNWLIGVRRDAPELPALLESGGGAERRHIAAGLRWALNGDDGGALREFEKHFSKPVREIFVQDVSLLQSASLNPGAPYGYLRRWKEAQTFEERARVARMLRFLPHGFRGEGWYGPVNEELRGEVAIWVDEALTKGSETELATRLRDSAWLKSKALPTPPPRVWIPEGTPPESPPARKQNPCQRLFSWLKTQG